MSAKRIIAIAVAMALVVAAVSGYFVDQKFREWSEGAEVALAFGEAEKARADSAVTWAGEQAAEAAARAPEIRERIVRVRAESPPDPARDSIIDDLVVEAGQWRAAYDSVSYAYAVLTVAYDSIAGVLEDRPKPRSKWTPRFSVGVFAGVCTDGRPCVGFGPGITIEVNIPTPF